MTTILCLKWGSKFSPDYVNNLYSGISRHTTRDFEFKCITENPKGLLPDIDIIPLPDLNLIGWWNKLYMFSSRINFEVGQELLYIDLDTLIIDNIDFLFEDSGAITTLRDVYYGFAPKVKKTDIGSAIMRWNHGDYFHIWDFFDINPLKAIGSTFKGDQEWIQRFTKDRKYWQDLAPGKIVSYKANCLEGVPKDCSIICYHGKPSIVESFSEFTKIFGKVIPPQEWVLDHWRS